MFEDTLVEGMPGPTRSASPMRTPMRNDAPPPASEPQTRPSQRIPQLPAQEYDEYGPIPKLEINSPGAQSRKVQLHTEFMYYTTLFKPLAGALTKTTDKMDICAWVTKLFGPEYHADAFKEKRNRYLCSLCLSMMNDELTGVFSQPPPPGALNHWLDIDSDEFPAAAWEMDSMWEETMNGIGGSHIAGRTVCNFHDDVSTDPCPEVSANTNRMMDDEFAFYLYLCRPYAALMPSADEKTKVSVWLNSLQMITRGACPTMKGMRNDYIQALLGCVYDLRTAGPFLDYPPVNRLYPLIEAAKLSAQAHPGVTDSLSREADDFMNAQSIPEEGAFCYFAITGDLQETSIPGLMKQTKQTKRPKTSPPRTSLGLTLSMPPRITDNRNKYINTRGDPKRERSRSATANHHKGSYEIEELYKKSNRTLSHN